MIIYADFTCPFSYLASLRADALIEGGAEVDWRAIEHEPDLPVTGEPADPAVIDDELSTVRDLLSPGEELPATTPAITPNTQAAISAYAEAVGAGVGDEARRSLYAAYWRDGLDIGDPEVVRELLATVVPRGDLATDPSHGSEHPVGADREPVTAEARRRVQAWDARWRGLTERTIPVVAHGDEVEFGIPALRRLRTGIDTTGRRAPD